MHQQTLYKYLQKLQTSSFNIHTKSITTTLTMAASHSAEHKLPPFEDLWEAYPDEGQSDILKSIGQPKDGSWRRETPSALKMSIALSKCGYKLPRTFVHKSDELKDKEGNLLCVDVADLVDTLKSHVGKFKNVSDVGKIAGKKGIVYFEDEEEIKDQSGHITLFDGVHTKGDEYFKSAKKTHFWEL